MKDFEVLSSKMGIVRRRGTGPRVLVVGGVHGDEPAGSVAVSFASEMSYEGADVTFIRRANPGGLSAGIRGVPESDGQDLNRSFPPTGIGEAAKLAVVISALARESDVVIDVHSAGADCVPHCIVCEPDDFSLSCAVASLGDATGMLCVSEMDQASAERQSLERSLRRWCISIGVPAVTLELREGDDPSAGARAIARATRWAADGMQLSCSAPAKRRLDLCCSASGELTMMVSGGDAVAVGGTVAEIGGRSVKSPFSGTVLFSQRERVVKKGWFLCAIAA